MIKLTTDIYYLLLSGKRIDSTAMPFVFTSENTGVSLRLIQNEMQLDNMTILDDTEVYTIVWPEPAIQKKLFAKGCKKLMVFCNHIETVDIPGLKLVVYPDIASGLLERNKLKSQQDICAGECAELITAIMDARRTDREEDYRHIEEEIVDVTLQTNILSSDVFSDEWHKKLNKLKDKFFS